MLPGMARDFLIGLGVRDGEEWWITLDFGGCTESMVLCIPIGLNWHEMELRSQRDPAILSQ